MKVNMLTGLNSLSKWLSFKNAGGMGTQVPILVDSLQQKGILADIDGTNSYDILHVHNPLPIVLPTIIKAKKARVPVILHARHLPELIKGGFKFQGIIHPIFKHYSRWLYNQADVVICATTYVERWMHNNGITTRTVVIPNGVDNHRFAYDIAARQKFRTAHNCLDSCVVFSVGLLIPRKGVHDFIDVANMLADEECYRFFWVGSSEPGLERVDTSNAPPNLRFMGHVPFSTMNEIYSGGDIFLFPTYAESYGNVLFEAAASERALIIRDIDIYKDLFAHHTNCLKGATAVDFTAHIRAVASDATLCSTLKENAKKLALEHDVSHTVNMLVDLYESLAL